MNRSAGMLALVGLIISCLAGLQSTARAAEVRLPEFSSRYIGQSVRHIKSDTALDWSSALTLIRKKPLLSDEIPNLGYMKGEHWFHFSVVSSQDSTYYFSYEYPLMQHIKILRLQDGRIVDERAGGKLMPMEEREVADRIHAFRFNLLKNETSEFLVRLRTSGAVNFPLKIHTEKSYPTERSADFFLFALYFGALASLVLYNLFLSFSIAQSSYLYYSCYLAAVGFVHFFVFGFANLYLFPSSGYVNEVGTVVVTGMSFFFLTLFARSYLSVPRTSFLNRYAVMPVLIFNLAVVTGGLFFYGTTVIRLTGLTAVLSPLVVLLLSVVSVKRGHVEARFLLAGMLFFIVGSFMYGMKDFALLPKNSITEHGAAVGTAMEAVLLSLGLAYKYKFLQAKNAELQVMNARSSAVSDMISAISHDVRKPFSMFKMLMDAIQTIKEPAEVKEFAAASLPEVQRAVDSVEGLLQDVMQVNAEVQLTTEVISPEQVLTTVLEQTFRGQPESDVTIETQIADGLALKIDTHKCQRIFANIIGNACQAIGWRGRIWIRAWRKGDRISFTLGNEGSFIPSQSLAQLFDAFYTSNKMGGTGLGLAIAKKWTEAHGGRINCRSERNERYPQGMVEFQLDLPAGDAEWTIGRPQIHGNSQAYRMVLGLESREEEDAAVDALGSHLKQTLLQRAHSLNIVAIDDEQAYLAGLEKALNRLGVTSQVALVTTTRVEEVRRTRCDLLLADFDLNLPDCNGLDVIREFKENCPEGFACLHTNRTDSDAFKSAMAAGADSVYPKPIAIEHLAKLLLEAARNS